MADERTPAEIANDEAKSVADELAAILNYHDANAATVALARSALSVVYAAGVVAGNENPEMSLDQAAFELPNPVDPVVRYGTARLPPDAVAMIRIRYIGGDAMTTLVEGVHALLESIGGPEPVIEVTDGLTDHDMILELYMPK